jgi:hypothetical protein
MTLLLCLAFSGLVTAAAQQSSPQPPVPVETAAQKPEAGRPPEVAPTLDPDDLPVSLTRIQRALSRPPALRLIGDKPVFRVEILGRKPTIEDILGPDYLKGPVSGGAMTHQEFLAMVTPKDVQGFAAFNNKEAFTVAATSIALQWALMRAIRKYEDAKKERDKEAAQREVQDALAALAKARQRAGLPPK